MTKYKYYFKKPKTEIVKDVFKWLAIIGGVWIAASSPYFILNLQRAYKRWKRYPKKKVLSTFDYLRREGYLNIEKKGKQIYISLTEKGKAKARWLQINDLKIKRPKKWDKKWRVVIFDISQLKKIHREAFRGKLKELGFLPLQKSVWIHPFECKDEIDLLRDFFGLKEKEIRLILAKSIGEDSEFKKKFNLS